MMNARARLLSWVRAPVSEEEFERVYRIELPRIYNFFRYRVGDGPIAEDLTADTFEKAWRKRHRYRYRPRHRELRPLTKGRTSP